MKELKEFVNPRVFDIPDYDQGHVTQCWKNKNIHRLMSNESSYSPIPPVIKAIRNIAPYANFYPEDPTYSLSLRSKLAKYSTVDIKNITLGNGSIEILDLLFQLFLSKPGNDECILMQPDYSAYTPRLKYFGWNINVATCPENIEQAMSNMIQMITPKTKIILFSRPNNPLGTIIPKKDIQDLLNTGLIIIIDEAYIEFANKNDSLTSWVKDWDNLLVTRTFSKGFGLAGIRLGYLIAHPNIINYVNRSRHIFNVNITAIAAGEAAMDHVSEYKRRFKIIIKTRDWAQEEINKIPGLKVTKSKGNFIMVNTEESGIHAQEYVSYLLENNFFVRDFSNKHGLKPNTNFRISIGRPEEMKEVVTLLSAFVDKRLHKGHRESINI